MGLRLEPRRNDSTQRHTHSQQDKSEPLITWKETTILIPVNTLPKIDALALRLSKSGTQCNKQTTYL